MSDCTLGRYNDTWITGGTFGSVTACTCPNCTEREATVQAEANARRKALLALDQAMKDLMSTPINPHKFDELAEGRIASVADAWEAARRFVVGGGE